MIHHLNGKYHAFFIRPNGSIAGIFKSRKGVTPNRYAVKHCANPIDCVNCRMERRYREGLFHHV